MMILNNFYFHDLSWKWHLGRQEGGFPIDDDTGVILMESLDIQDNITDHPEQLLIKKYWRKTLLLLRSGRSEPSVSRVQDDVKDQESSGMWI